MEIRRAFRRSWRAARFAPATLICGLAWLAPAPAVATPVRVDALLSFYPPNPCAATELGDLTGYALGGTFEFFRRLGPAGDLIPLVPDPGPPELGGIACGARGRTAFTFDLAPGESLLLSFAGAIAMPEPGPPEYPVFAMFVPEPGPPEVPAAAPLFDLGEVAIPDPGPPEILSLYAFASPGHLIGTLEISAAPIPAPAGMALMLAGLAALAGTRQRREGGAAPS